MHKLDERFVFAILRSRMPIKTKNEDEEKKEEEKEECKLDESIDGDSDYEIIQLRDSEQSISTEQSTTDVDIADVDIADVINDLTEGMNLTADTQSSSEAEVSWALEHLEHFKNRTTYKDLFDIPDLTETLPAYTFTPQLMDAMDSVLTSSHLPQCQTLLYDKHTCSLIWLRRDCSSYEIYTHTQNALDYAKRFILNTMFELITSGKVDQSHLTPNTSYWISAYHQLQYAQMIQKHHLHNRWNKKNKTKNKDKTGNEEKDTQHYQNRKNRKRQCLHS